MKNKPHPRWAQKPSPNDEDILQWSAHARRSSADTSSSESPSTPVTPNHFDAERSNGGFFTPSSEALDPFIASNCAPVQQPNIQLSIVSPTPVGTPCPDESQLLRPPSFHHNFASSSPFSSASSMPSPVSPISSLGSFTGTPVTPTSPCFGISSTFTSPPFVQTDLENSSFDNLLCQIRELHTEEDKSQNGKQSEHINSEVPREYNSSSNCQCGCLANEWAYTTIIELADRLQKAVEVLGQLSNHNNSAECSLYTKIADLRNLTS